MRRTLLLIAAGVTAFALSLVVFLPASLIAHALPAGVTTGVLSGTVWNGATDALSIDNHLIGGLRWRVRPLELFRGRLALDAEIAAPGGGGNGYVSVGFGRRVDLENVALRWSLGALPVRVLPPGWSGDLQANLPRIRLQGSAIEEIVGTVEALNLREPLPNGVAVGSYRLTFDETASQGERIVGRLQDLAGPMQVSGSVTLTHDHGYVIDGLVAARSSAPPTMVERLRYLGSPDAQGRRPFSLAGTY